jgi:hypothetical protein
MHRLLLTTLVVVLLGLAWNARRAEVVATGPRHEGGRDIADEPGGLVGAQDGTGDRDALAGAAFVRTSRLSEPALHERLEARVEARPDVWSALEQLETPPGPPAEQVLADAEVWMETHFPEGGDTADGAEGEFAPDREASLAGVLPSAERELAQAGVPAGTEQPAPEPADAPVYLAALARIESLSGDLPAWCGLLDLSLLPARVADLRALAAADGDPAGADTAWISDERGQLIARVEALQGLGLELDPSWPWNTRARRLYWTEAGLGGLPARQFRLVLEGNGLVPSWSGRLVLLRSGAGQFPPARR